MLHFAPVFTKNLLVAPSWADTVWTFVHIESCPNSMPSTVAVIFSNFPQCFACKDIKDKSRCIFGKNHRVNTNVSFQYPGVQFSEF